jgi:biotin carboxyl carrier protein
MEQEKDTTPNQMVELVIDDVVYNTRLNAMYHRRKGYEPHNPALLRAFMPGNIPDVFVAEGDMVKEGENLLILEAMKMKNIIKAPYDGKIKNIFVTTGDTIPKNFILIEMEDQPSATE